VNERAAIRLTDEEADALLAEPHKLQVATINPDGTPHLVTMYYAPHDGGVAFWTYRTSQKVRNLERDPRLTCLIETGDSYDQFRGWQVTGEAELIDDPDRVVSIGKEIYGRYLGTLEGEVLAYVEKMALKRVVIVVRPGKVTSWDHRRLTAV
jgi:PPOX class probable F420-dependent enzyme